MAANEVVISEDNGFQPKFIESMLGGGGMSGDGSSGGGFITSGDATTGGNTGSGVGVGAPPPAPIFSGIDLSFLGGAGSQGFRMPIWGWVLLIGAGGFLLIKAFK